MGKLHCFEETGENRQARPDEWWRMRNGTIGEGPTTLSHDILRRLPDDEAEAMRTAREQCEALRDMLATRDHEILAMKERHAAEIARLERVIAVLSERPKVDEEEREIERMAEALMLKQSDGAITSNPSTWPHACFRWAEAFITERNRRRAERGGEA